MAGYPDLIAWCNSAAMPNNRQTAVSVNLYQAPAPGQPAEAAWVGTLDTVPPVAPETFELQGELEPLEPRYGQAQLHVVIDISNPANEVASATIRGNHIKPEWSAKNSKLVYNEQSDYFQDAVISGKIEIIDPNYTATTLYPVILGPTYTYHPHP